MRRSAYRSKMLVGWAVQSYNFSRSSILSSITVNIFSIITHSKKIATVKNEIVELKKGKIESIFLSSTLDMDIKYKN